MMRLDVIDIRCRRQEPLLHALLTVRMLTDEALSQISPTSVVPSFTGTAFPCKAMGFSIFLGLFSHRLIALNADFPMTVAIAFASRRRHVATRI